MERSRVEEAEFDLYDALNLQRDASAEDVRSAFRDLSRVYHPDKNTSSAGSVGGSTGSTGGDGAFMQIHRAYRILGDDVLRSFYDRYGLPGIRIAENLSDENDDVAGHRLALPEDRLKDLETRVRQLVGRHHELRTQRLLALQGSFTLSMAAGPGLHGAHLRRRYRLQYSATSHSVQIAICKHLKLTVGCASHVQGAKGVGVAKLMLAASSQLNPLTIVRTGLNVTGSSPEAEMSVVRIVTPHCTVQQKASMSSDGGTMSLTVYPWLSRTLRGSIGYSVGEDRSMSFGLVHKSASSRHKIRAFLNVQPGTGELGTQLKYKPSEDFSLKLAPTISAQGWTIQAICTKAFPDGLTKLHWALRLRRRSLSLRLTICRTGLRFSFPVELWPESAGPVPLSELGLAMVLWSAPPLVLRLLRLLGQSVLEAVKGSPALLGTTFASPVHDPSTGVPNAQDDVVSAAETEAQEQRRLVAQEAARRRSEEVSKRGLVILKARYGAPKHIFDTSAMSQGVVDVTDCLMAKVRRSQLHISNAPKSSLFGFYDPCAGIGAPVLHISYRFGEIEYSRTFSNTEAVLLP